MIATTNKNSEEEIATKSPEDLEAEYRRLLEEYDRLTREVDSQIRSMRGGRIVNWHALFARLLNRKPEQKH